MQDEKGLNKFYLYIFAVMAVSFLGLRVISYFTKYGAVEIGGQKFRVEIMKKDWELAQGLSGRDSLKNGSGMLFVFPAEDRHEFWMKGMKFPIDIIWISGGKIVDIKKSAPLPVTLNLEKYVPSVPAKYVLEIGAGLSEKYGFKPGDEVELDI